MRPSDQAVAGGTAKVHRPRSRSGPRAPAGKAALQVLVAEHVIRDAKVKAILDRTNLSRVVEILIAGWLDGTFRLKN